MKRIWKSLFGLLLAISLTACGGGIKAEPPMDDTAIVAPETANETSVEERTVTKMNVQVGGTIFTATLEENDAADALADMLRAAPLTVQMNDHGGFEKVGPLGTSLPASNSQITAQAGDIVLYNGDQVVVFYGSNSWSYTRLGKIDELSGWEDALGGGDVSVTFSLSQPHRVKLRR